MIPDPAFRFGNTHGERYYDTKQILVVYVIEDNITVVITVYTFFF